MEQGMLKSFQNYTIEVCSSIQIEWGKIWQPDYNFRMNWWSGQDFIPILCFRISQRFPCTWHVGIRFNLPNRVDVLKWMPGQCKTVHSAVGCGPVFLDVRREAPHWRSPCLRLGCFTCFVYSYHVDFLLRSLRKLVWTEGFWCWSIVANRD